MSLRGTVALEAIRIYPDSAFSSILVFSRVYFWRLRISFLFCLHSILLAGERDPYCRPNVTETASRYRK